MLLFSPFSPWILWLLSGGHGSGHAVAEGWGRGEFSGALANLRAVVSIVTPIVLGACARMYLIILFLCHSAAGNVYSWSTTGGRNMPALAYLLVSVCELGTEFVWRGLSEDDLKVPKKKE